MTTAGLIFMVVSLSFVWGLAIWCYRQVLTGPDEAPSDDSHDS